MKKILFVLLFFYHIHNSLAIKSYDVNDTLFVWAKNGLFLRNEPNGNAQKIAKLEYGTPLIVTQQALKTVPFTIEEFKKFKIKGFWVQVIVDNQIGYVFDGYLSKLPPLQKNNAGKIEDFSEYAKREFKVLKEDKKKWIDKIGDTNSEEFITYGNGISTKQNQSYCCGGTGIFIKNITIEEGYLIAFVLFDWSKETYKIMAFRDNEIICDYQLLETDGGANDITISKIDNKILINNSFAAP